MKKGAKMQNTLEEIIKYLGDTFACEQLSEGHLYQAHHNIDVDLIINKDGEGEITLCYHNEPRKTRGCYYFDSIEEAHNAFVDWYNRQQRGAKL